MLYLDLQNTITSDNVPDKEKIELWITLALAETEYNDDCELTIRIVDKEEIRLLNKSYRHKDKETNVLSFPFEAFPYDDSVQNQIEMPLLGDIVICHDVVVEQAKEQNKTIEAHWAHMVIHGVLHLQGYDHIEDKEAQLMESLEVLILKKLSIADPYQF